MPSPLHYIKKITAPINVASLLRELPFILFITFLLMFYIASGHRADRLVRQINKLHYEVKDAKTEFVIRKAKVVSMTKESELLRILKNKNFESLNDIPILIRDSLSATD